MKNLKTIQEAIEAKARKRAEDEVLAALKAFRVLTESDVFKNTHIKIDDKSVRLNQALWWTNDTLPKAVIEELTQKYIPQEVEKFVKDVEGLKTDVDQLYSHSQNF